jgi:hypothetical protein
MLLVLMCTSYAAYKDRADALEELLNKAVERLMMAEADTQTLINILTTMKEEHNPNYHDMAVKHAITAFEGLEKERAQRGGSLGTADLIPPPQVDDSEFDGSTADKRKCIIIYSVAILTDIW